MTNIGSIPPELAEIPAISQSFCYVLIKPDVVLRKIVSDVFEYFELRGFRLIDYRCGCLSSQLYHAMYERAFLWKLDHWSYNKKAYEFGPVIGTMFWGEPSILENCSAHAYLLSKKGAALPENLLVGSLREQLGATSRVYNVLHIPDSISQSLLEASEWFGASYVQETLTKVLNSSSKTTVSKYSSLIEYEVDGHGYLLDRMLNGQATYTLIKVRLLHALKRYPGVNRTLANALCNLEIYYYNISRKLLEKSEKDLLSEYEAEKGYLETVLTKLQQNEENDNLPKVFQIFLELLDRRKVTQQALDFFWYLMSAWNVYVSALEKYLVDIYFFYPTML